MSDTTPAASQDQIQAAITDLIPKLLTALEAFEHLQKNLHPHRFQQVCEFTKPFGDELAEVYGLFEPMVFPDDLIEFKTMMATSAKYCLRAYEGLANHEAGFGEVMKALRAHCRAQEFLLPLAPMLSPVNRYFIEASKREDTELVNTIAAAGQAAGAPELAGQSGILSSENERDKRGGFSLYIPEQLDTTKPASLVIALHGGTGHGADFIWSWIREARTRGFIVLAPTSAGDTWSLMGEELDYARLIAQINWTKRNFAIDDEHIMLSGMSDGATYTMLAACREDNPFTHLAPFSGVLHPDIIPNLNSTNMSHLIKDKPIYLVHGSEDWMFPVETAQLAQQQLEAAGAALVYREIEDLPHTFARSELPQLLTWFNPELA